MSLYLNRYGAAALFRYRIAFLRLTTFGLRYKYNDFTLDGLDGADVLDGLVYNST